MNKTFYIVIFRFEIIILTGTFINPTYQILNFNYCLGVLCDSVAIFEISNKMGEIKRIVCFLQLFDINSEAKKM